MSSNFLRNIRTCICIRKKYKNGEFSPFYFWPKHCTIVQGLWSDFGATLKIHNKSKFHQNELKLSRQLPDFKICKKSKINEK